MVQVYDDEAGEVSTMENAASVPAVNASHDVSESNSHLSSAV